MTLIKSISGIRGTIGGDPGEGLTPQDVVKFASGFGQWVKQKSSLSKIVIGRDARLSGDMVSKLTSATLQGLGLDVVDLGLSTTPTVEMAVVAEKAGGGIILTASHNPKEWNALKLLNAKGEFVSAADGAEILQLADHHKVEYAGVDDLGSYVAKDGYLDYHIKKILELDLVDVKAIQAAEFKIIIDCVNSTGGIALPLLFKNLGIEERVTLLYCDPNGHFPHNPEPLPEHLTEISEKVSSSDFDLGIVVDPDVDRLAFVNEDGSLFGEEYTLVAISDYILKHKKGAAVSNLSSTRALKDVCHKHGVQYGASAVGEVNVVEKMKEMEAVIGGEGNGGVIYPELHYGRDALVGIALFLTHLALSKLKMTELKALYPAYTISKNKIDLSPTLDVDMLLKEVKAKYSSFEVNDTDGVKVDFENGWVHLRKSNTEPIIRVYSESHNPQKADELAQEVMEEIDRIIFSNASSIN